MLVLWLVLVLLSLVVSFEGMVAESLERVLMVCGSIGLVGIESAEHGFMYCFGERSLQFMTVDDSWLVISM
jgi:hypothetical protein